MRYLLGLLLAVASALNAEAGIITLTLLPSDPTASNVVAGSSNAPGFPTGSWASPGVGGKSEWYLPASALFSGPVTVNDIASISYWTNKPTTGADPDWTFYIYTAKQSGDPNFYHSRLNSEPLYTSSIVPPNTWHEWSTNNGANSMRFYDANRNGGIFGTFADPTLAMLQGGPFTWPNSVSNNYGSEIISLFSLQTGSAWANGFTGQVDGLTITLKNGDIGIVNFESQVAPAAVPEPASLAVWSLIVAIGGACGWRLRASVV
jgi:hypothetical protein